MHVGVYVIPVKAGIQYHCLFLDSRLCGNDRLKRTFVMQLSIVYLAYVFAFFRGFLEALTTSHYW